MDKETKLLLTVLTILNGTLSNTADWSWNQNFDYMLENSVQAAKKTLEKVEEESREEII